MIIHEYLETRQVGAGEAIVCRKCGHVFCGKGENYKRHALRRVRDAYRLHSGVELIDEPAIPALLHEYFCPGCATQLQVDVYMPATDDDEPLWDIQMA